MARPCFRAHGAAMLSVARRLLCAAHRGSQSSRTPKPRGSHSQHAARTRPAVSGTGERRVCSTCSRLLVEPRRDPASMCTQVLATGSSALFRPFRLGGQAFATRVVAARPYAAKHCEGWRVAGAGRVVKRARRAGKGGMGGAGAGRVSPQRAAARCLYESSSRAPRRGTRPKFAGGGADHFAGKRTTETLYRSSALGIRWGLADVRLEPKAAV